MPTNVYDSMWLGSFASDAEVEQVIRSTGVAAKAPGVWVDTPIPGFKYTNTVLGMVLEYNGTTWQPVTNAAIGYYANDAAADAGITAAGATKTDGICYYNTTWGILMRWDATEARWRAAEGGELRENVRYVDASVPAGGDGSFEMPYDTIQAAVDYFFANPSGGLDAVHIAAGFYPENVVVRNTAIALIGEDRHTTYIRPATGVPLTFTNATLASLAAYRISGDYADLINMGSAGPGDVIVSGLYLTVGDFAANALEFLGVAGDASATTTAFLCGGPIALGGEIHDCLLQLNFRARNAGWIGFTRCTTYNLQCYNLANLVLERCNCVGNVINDFDAASIYGRPTLSPFGMQARYTKMQDFTLSGTAYTSTLFHADFVKNYMETVSVEDTAVLTSWATTIAKNLSCEAAASYDGHDDFIQGNLSFAAGVGTARLDGGRYMGTLTDPGAKFVRNVGA